MALEIDFLHSRRNVPVDAPEIFANLIFAVRLKFVAETFQRTTALTEAQTANAPSHIDLEVSKFFGQFRRQRHSPFFQMAAPYRACIRSRSSQGIGVCLRTSATISSDATFSTS